MLFWTGLGLRLNPESEVEYSNESNHKGFIFLLEQ